MRRSLRAAALAVVGTLACHPAHPETHPAVSPCLPPAGFLPHGATATGLAGDYRLRITATAGSVTGRWVEGALRLRPTSDSVSRQVVVLGVRDTTSSFPLSGTSDLDAAALGAVNTGSLTAQSPEAPGVLVIERRPTRAMAGTEIMLRLGAEANRRGVTRYDGGYFVLNVRSITPTGFAGTWSSGLSGAGAGGHFCAERLGADG